LLLCNVLSARYGYSFHLLSDVPLYHPDTSCYEVRSSDGAHVGLWYFDPYARAGKRSGAWMSEYRAQHAQDSCTPIVSNNCNFTQPAPGECTLLSWDDAVTLFHEFGHALHGLSSRVTYHPLAGTSTTRDHVELPSQLNEHWLQTPELLQKYACHVTEGSPLPMELVKKIEAASKFAQGFGTVEFLASAIVDLRMHCAPSDLGGLTLLQFQAKVLADVQLPPQIVMRHATTHFAHVFGDDGYSAAYVSPFLHCIYVTIHVQVLELPVGRRARFRRCRRVQGSTGRHVRQGNSQEVLRLHFVTRQHARTR
jgi:peptidyl-dipeptidase Dcp